MRFIHTADWQLGKPFGRIEDPQKRALVQQQRFEAVKRIGEVAREAGADFVLVAGDLFDSRSADKPTVSAACSAIGQIGVPVIAIPGNHDYAGPGSVWEQDFFQREQAALAPNLTVLLTPEAYDAGSAVILPCPPAYRSVAADPTEWLCLSRWYENVSPDKPRIVLAHGSTQGFTGQWADEDEDVWAAAGVIDVERLAEAEVDYVALGDWHGTKQVGAKAWYAGTPELDRFPRGKEQDPGNVLVVDGERGETPRVAKVRTARFGWHEVAFPLPDDASVGELETRLGALLGQRANEDLLLLELSGTIGIEAYSRLDRLLESLEARLLRLKLVDRVTLAPSPEELEALLHGGDDPLIARVAAQLVERVAGDDEEAAVARVALRELYAAWREGAGS